MSCVKRTTPAPPGEWASRTAGVEAESKNFDSAVDLNFVQTVGLILRDVDQEM